MLSSFQHLRLAQVEQALAPFAMLAGRVAPSGGWLKAIRESQGRSLRGQAQRLQISAPSLHKSEAAETAGRISLGQLRKLAQGLDCELVYALVPREPLSKMLDAQADRVARHEVLGVAHSMSLEDQRPPDQFLEMQVAARKSGLLEGSWARRLT